MMSFLRLASAVLAICLAGFPAAAQVCIFPNTIEGCEFDGCELDFDFDQRYRHRGNQQRRSGSAPRPRRIQQRRGPESGDGVHRPPDHAADDDRSQLPHHRDFQRPPARRLRPHQLRTRAHLGRSAEPHRRQRRRGGGARKHHRAKRQPDADFRRIPWTTSCPTSSAPRWKRGTCTRFISASRRARAD